MRSPDNRNDPVRLAIFDLDNTLITSDSDHLWGEYLAERGIVDGEHYRRRNDQYLAEYQAGTLDIHDFLRFSLRVLAEHDPAELARLRAGFIEEKIAPTVAPGAPSLLARHRDAGDHLMIITATNSFVTEPIARMLGVETLIATEPEQRDGRYTGDVTGTPCFRRARSNVWGYGWRKTGPICRAARSTATPTMISRCSSKSNVPARSTPTNSSPLRRGNATGR